MSDKIGLPGAAERAAQRLERHGQPLTGGGFLEDGRVVTGGGKDGVQWPTLLPVPPSDALVWPFRSPAGRRLRRDRLGADEHQPELADLRSLPGRLHRLDPRPIPRHPPLRCLTMSPGARRRALPDFLPAKNSPEEYFLDPRHRVTQSLPVLTSNRPGHLDDRRVRRGEQWPLLDFGYGDIQQSAGYETCSFGRLSSATRAAPAATFHVTRFDDDNGACTADDCALRERSSPPTRRRTPTTSCFPPAATCCRSPDPTRTFRSTGDIDILGAGHARRRADGKNHRRWRRHRQCDRHCHVRARPVIFRRLVITGGAAAPGFSVTGGRIDSSMPTSPSRIMRNRWATGLSRPVGLRTPSWQHLYRIVADRQTMSPSFAVAAFTPWACRSHYP